MPRYLCISVTLLDDLFHGCRDDDEPEWPPSPMRLFQALLAGSKLASRNGDWNDQKAAAFRWLESLQPPVIIAPESQRATAYTLYVPNNDADQIFERQDRLTSKIVRPQRICNAAGAGCDLPQLHYLWKISTKEPDEAEKYCDVLCREARRLVALGWGIDQAVASGRVLSDAELAALPGQRWFPRRGIQQEPRMLRIPKPGSLADCQRVYQAFIERVRCERRGRRTGLGYARPDRLRCFDRVAYVLTTSVPPRPYAAFELPEGVAFCQENTVAVAAMLRKLACNQEQDFSEQFPDDNTEIYLAGHVKGAGHTPPRFSYLPLPSIGHEHADGLIRRVLIAEPFGGDGRRAAWAQQRLLNQAIRDHDGNERGALMNLWRKTSRRIIDRYYACKARNWATVTPVILPGFDDFRGVSKQDQQAGRATKAEQLFMKAVVQAGLPAEIIEMFTLRKAPFWPGSTHASRYKRPDYLDTSQNHRFPAWHVHVRFREPIPGPIAIGAGRHCGLGLFAAL
ncbi:MAG TPA: type I-U CRISPR-associated protein Csb2 [Tepidisphaeraceae bacterium]|nr:type I-U CRISPR-associated protein Csb2 [Tepidisphaeraceae bacterium]